VPELVTLDLGKDSGGLVSAVGEHGGPVFRAGVVVGQVGEAEGFAEDDVEDGLRRKGEEARKMAGEGGDGKDEKNKNRKRRQNQSEF
jgi:hypothetical protein